jgi:NAD(P)-dependent dehydrogenase (short-subunit alcohol dehydrogenase family)
MWQVNVMGAVRLSRLVARRWIERSDSGAIVNITSVAGGLRAAHRQSAYGASKAALNSLTQTIAAELGPYGIRVNAIACGLINTRLSAPIFERPSVLAKIISKTPLRRAGVPEEVAEAALFLLGNRSRFTTGQISVIDGGISL